MARSVLRAAAASGCSSLSFWVHKAGPESWDTQNVLCGISGPAVPSPGSLQPQTVTLCPSRAGQEPFVSCRAQIRVLDTGNSPAPVLARVCSWPALNVEIWTGTQPELGGMRDTRELSQNTKLILCPDSVCGVVCLCFGQPGALGRARWGSGARSCPSPAHQAPAPGLCLCHTPRPSPSRWSCQCDNAVQCCYRSHVSVVNVNGRNMVNMDTFSFQM